jgi:hypothetical protein
MSAIAQKAYFATKKEVIELINEANEAKKIYDCNEFSSNDELELATILKNNIEFTYDSDTKCLTIIKCNNVFSRLSRLHLLVDYAYVGSVVIDHGAFHNNTNLVTLRLGVETTTPVYVKRSAFCGCYNLKYFDFNIAAEITNDACANAFDFCESLQSVNLRNSTMTCISFNMFSSCISLSRVVLPDTLERIESGAFLHCDYLSNTIKMPKTVNYIGYSAFSGYDLTFDFTNHEFVPTLQMYGLGDKREVTILVPSALYDNWCTDTNWVEYRNCIVAK